MTAKQKGLLTPWLRADLARSMEYSIDVYADPSRRHIVSLVFGHRDDRVLWGRGRTFDQAFEVALRGLAQAIEAGLCKKVQS